MIEGKKGNNTHCSSICLISALNVLISLPFLAFAFNGLSSNNNSSNSCDASKFAFFDCYSAHDQIHIHTRIQNPKSDESTGRC